MKKLFGRNKEKKTDAVPTKNVLVHRLHGNVEPAARGAKNNADHMVAPMPDLSWMDEKNQK